MNLKKLSEQLDFSKSKVYVFRKWIFRSVIVLMLFLGVVSWGLQGWGNPLQNRLYVRCEGERPCENLFYHNFAYCGTADSFLCSSETLPRNFVYGQAPNWINQNFFMLVAILIVAAFVVNHFLYNRKVKLRGLVRL